MIGPTDIQIILGKVRPLSRPHPEAHPQVLIIARCHRSASDHRVRRAGRLPRHPIAHRTIHRQSRQDTAAAALGDHQHQRRHADLPTRDPRHRAQNPHRPRLQTWVLSKMSKLRSEPGVVRDVGAVEGVAARGEGGLLGLATAGDAVFAYLTTATDNRVVRMDFDGQALGPPAPILTGIPTGGSRHDGGRIAFGPDGRLYVATGGIGDPPLAQDRSSLAGKILRINPDGSIPADNPDPQSPVWSFGHRNVQGLAWDPGGRLWATEYGAGTWDELNLIEPGGNYGWPVAEGRQEMPGM